METIQNLEVLDKVFSKVEDVIKYKLNAYLLYGEQKSMMRLNKI